MILKIIPYKRIQAVPRVIAYCTEDDRKFDQNGRSFVVTRNLRGQTPAEWYGEIAANEKTRIHKRKNNNVLTMEVISFHKRDNAHLTPKKLEKIAREYIRLRGHHGIFIAVPHFDKQYHLHILAAGLGYKTGRSFGMSRAKLAEIKRDLQAFQQEKYPELSYSLVRHGRKKAAKVTEKEYQYKRRTGKKSDREIVREIIQECFAHATTQEELFELLKGKGMEPYTRGTKSSGVVYEGAKYRLNRLGFDLAKIGEKEREMERGKWLQKSRANKTRDLAQSDNERIQ